MQREYGLDLVVELPRMSFRRFMVLVRGLGPQSATVTRQINRRYMGGPAGGPAVVVTRSPSESRAALASFFGRRQSSKVS